MCSSAPSPPPRLPVRDCSLLPSSNTCSSYVLAGDGHKIAWWCIHGTLWQPLLQTAVSRQYCTALSQQAQGHTQMRLIKLVLGNIEGCWGNGALPILVREM